MGKIQHQRHVYVPYTETLIAVWKRMPQSWREQLDAIGRPTGYSGQNVLYFMMVLCNIVRKGKYTFQELMYEEKE